MTELNKELCKQVDLLEKSVKHLEELKLLSEMRARKRKQEREERDAKVYEDYDWTDLIPSGNLKKLTIKEELEKYMDYDKLPRKYLSKNGKLECIIDHYYRVRGEHIDDSGDSSGSEDE